MQGQGEFSAPDGTLLRIISVEEITTLDTGPLISKTARPIWEIALEIGESVPDADWKQIPKDLSKNLDHYLYGAPRKQ